MVRELLCVLSYTDDIVDFVETIVDLKTKVLVSTAGGKLCSHLNERYVYLSFSPFFKLTRRFLAR